MAGMEPVRGITVLLGPLQFKAKPLPATGDLKRNTPMHPGRTLGLSILNITTFRLVVLLGGLAVAGYFDWRTREVPDGLWVVMGALGAVLLLLEAYGSASVVLALDLVAALFVLEHFVPWDKPLEKHESLTMAIEAAFYIVVVALTVYAYIFWNSTVLANPEFLMVVASVLIARGLYEARLLWGGADAKALMASGLLLPIFAQPLVEAYPSRITLVGLQYIPFAVTVLIDGAILTLVIPVALLVYNASRGYYSLPQAFNIFEIPTEELPHRFVWLRKPEMEVNNYLDTTEEDNEMRQKQADELLSKGVEKVWVTPQIPMVTALALGALAGVLVGNFLFWLL
jgi:hypothetical protein